MEQASIVQIRLFKRAKAALSLSVYLVGITQFAWFAGRVLGISASAVTIFWMAGVLLVFLGLKKFRDLFSVNGCLSLDTSEMGITIPDKTGATVYHYPWTDINSCGCLTAQSLTILKLYFKNGTKKVLVFREEKLPIAQTVEPDSILGLFLKHVSTYNHSNTEDRRINLTPPFLATKEGGYVLLANAILITIAVVLHFVYFKQGHHKAADFSTLLIPIGCFITLLGGRRQSLVLKSKLESALA